MTVKLFAKINLGLEVVRKRPDGYHDIRTLFQTVTLADELDVEAGPDGRIDLEGDDASISWDGTNLIHRAARLLRDTTGAGGGARIAVKKNVPAGRGLGGGSSNAAVTLIALNSLWRLGLATGELAGLARALGARCPLFFTGGTLPGGGDRRPADPAPRSGPLALPVRLPAVPHPDGRDLRRLGAELDFRGQNQ